MHEHLHLTRIIHEGDLPGLVEWCWRQHRVGLCEEAARLLLKDARRFCGVAFENTPDYACLVSGDMHSPSWVKLWLSRQGHLPARGNMPQDVRVTTELHVGFVGVEENERHWELLLAPDVSELLKEGPATPGIARTEVLLTPIARVAARVAGFLHAEPREGGHERKGTG